MIPEPPEPEEPDPDLTDEQRAALGLAPMWPPEEAP